MHPEETPLIKKGARALLNRDLPTACRAFSTAYRVQDWEVRDLAVTGLSDMLDREVYEHGKPPSLLVALGWHSEKRDKESQPVPDDRVLILLENYMRRSLVSPETIAEKKCLQAMRRATGLLEKILLNDPHYLVRFSAFLALRSIPGEGQVHFVFPTFRQAVRQEDHPPLAAAIEAELAYTEDE